MNLEELKNFDFNDLDNLGSAPLPIRIFLAALVLGGILFIGYKFDSSQLQMNLESSERKETQLRKTFERKYQQSANLEAYKAQLAEMELEFGSMVRQLPGKTEIPGVIVDISQTGLAAGLKIQLFKPQDEVKQGFYAEKPILIRVVGQYDQMAKFSSDVAALPRIVTLHDVEIKPAKQDEGKPHTLSMDVTAKTYRYLDDNEIAEMLAEKGKGKGKKK
ncbi:MAG: type 4a pilus biogenesis protein PilO [bacterium]